MYVEPNDISVRGHHLLFLTQVRSCHALIKCGAKIDQADHMGTTALHYAAFLGYCSVISLLLSKGATPLLRDCQVKGVAQ